jgi:hypothetical protein
MKPAELQTELAYRVQERLGILCGANTPTAAQKRMAEAEAIEWCERWEFERWKERACNLDSQSLDSNTPVAASKAASRPVIRLFHPAGFLFQSRSVDAG